MKNVVRVVEAIGILLGLASGMAFNLKHHVFGIWLGVGAGCVVLIGLGIWLTFDDGKSEAKPDSLTTDPLLVLTPADLPPSQAPSSELPPAQQPIPPVSPVTQVTGGDGSINTVNQSGGNNVINNLGLQPRKLSNEQKQLITDALRPFSGAENLILFITNTEADSANFGNQFKT